MSTTERYRAKCLICGFGNCQAALRECPREMPLDLDPPRKFSERRAAERVPNRLYGVKINREGDAI